ncbi:MAG: hypothetical protein IPI22_15305 [Bacteroidetes bacterium]|nr:hypothetical protein [Bacteroidota bacterium]
MVLSIMYRWNYFVGEGKAKIDALNILNNHIHLIGQPEHHITPTIH